MKRVKKIFIDTDREDPRLVFYTNDNNEYEAVNFLDGFGIREIDNEPIDWGKELGNMKLTNISIDRNSMVETYSKDEKLSEDHKSYLREYLNTKIERHEKILKGLRLTLKDVNNNE